MSSDRWNRTRDLLGPQGSRGRHLSAGLSSTHPAIQRAPRAIARDYSHAIRTHAVRDGVSAAVETESAHLLGGAVALKAMIPQDRLNIAGKVHLRGNLGSQGFTKQPRGEDRGHYGGTVRVWHFV